MALNRNSPEFLLYPVNNNRTAWRPIAMPVILSVPRRRYPDGTSIEFSDIFNCRISFAKAPTNTKVAGIEHRDIIPPENQVYAIEIQNHELVKYYIDIKGCFLKRLLDPLNPAITQDIEFEDAKDGDIVQYTCLSGVTSSFTYYSDADYFDLSQVFLDTEDLTPSVYQLVYACSYYERLITEDDLAEFVCIDPNRVGFANLVMPINHPGDIIGEFHRLTPAIYLTSSDKANDSTLGLYRLFTDILQDVKDEQDLLGKINHVYSCSPEIIPYLSSQLGWELPYFPQSLSREIEGKTQTLDKLRRAILRRTVELQSLRGSARAITRIFNLFGYRALISNLWWTSDGKLLVQPGERLPTEYASQEIRYVDDPFTTDVVESGLKPTGFYQNSAYLINRPQVIDGIDGFEAYVDGGPITITSIICNDIQAEALKSLDLNGTSLYKGHRIPQSIIDFIESEQAFSVSIFRVPNTSKENIGESELDIPTPVNIGSLPSAVAIGENPVAMIARNTSFDRDENKLSYTLNGSFNNSKRQFFVFATYSRAAYVVPNELIPSNYFSLQVLNRSNSDTINGIALEFALDFLEKVKAFHSLLYLINTRIVADEVYQVTDFSVGGAVTQRYNTDAGKLQVPPAIIPIDPTVEGDYECSKLSAISLGYKDSDLKYRKLVIDNLIKEWQSYNAPTPVRIADLTLDLQLSQRRFHRLASITLSTLSGIAPLDSLSHNSTEKVWLLNAGQADIILSHQNWSTPDNRLILPQNADFLLEPGKLVFLSYDMSAKRWLVETEIDQDVYDLLPNYASLCASNVFGQQRITTDGYDLSYEVALPTPRTVDSGDWRTESAADEESDAAVADYCTSDSFTDYNYKGRVTDVIALQKQSEAEETWTATGCELSFGSGVYYTFPARSTLVHSGTKNPSGPSGRPIFSGGTNTNQVRGYIDEATTEVLTQDYKTSTDNRLGKLYKSYSHPANESLHYHSSGAGNTLLQRDNLALQRPSLNISKVDMFLPGCRFPTMNRLAADYTSGYELRPWDLESCDNPCTSSLNPTLTTDTDGSESLTYAALPYVVLGNNLTPDIPNMNDGAPATPAKVIHRIYSNGINSGSPAIAFDQLDYATGTTTSTDLIYYRSLLTGGSINDDVNGYPSIRGRVTISYSFSTSLADQMTDLPTFPTRTGYYWTLSSGILNAADGRRLNCSTMTGDQADLQSVLDLEEHVNAAVYFLNGEIADLLKTV